MLIKSRKGEEKVNKVQVQQRENSYKHSRYYSNYINNHLKCEWSKHNSLKQILPEWIKKTSPNYMLSIRNALKYKNSDKLKVKGTKTYHTDQKKAELAIFILNKADFRAREIIMDKDGHNVIIRSHNNLVYASDKKSIKKKNMA